MLDGVIKYHVEHSNIAAPDFVDFESLEATRTRLFALGLIGETAEGIGYGNLSMRSSANTFFITATQTGKLPALTKNQYTYISGYNFKTFSVFSQGPYKASSEALSHAMIYEVHPDIQAVIHVHPHALWQFMKTRGDLATTAEYGTTQMVEEIADLYQSNNPFNRNAFVMFGHEDGIITFGRNTAEAERSLYQIVQDYLSKP